MKIIKGSLWDYHNTYRYPNHPSIVCITTNGILNNKKELVMGAGIALTAKQKFPELPKRLGILVGLYGNLPFYLAEENIVSFPTKYDWKDYSDLELIENSAYLIKMMIDLNGWPNIYSPWPGRGMGGRTKEEIQPILEKIWADDRFIIVENE